MKGIFQMLPCKSMPSESVSLSSITTDKFKTGLLSFSVALENEKLISPYALLLTELLQRATESYKKKALLQKKLDELYSASVSIRCTKAGKNRIFTFSAEIIDNDYITDGIDVAGEICHILCELMFHPLLDENNLFSTESVEQEKRRVVTYLKSAINNPSRYASIRISEMLRRGDKNLMTLEEMIEAVETCDAKALTEFYRKVLTNRPIDVFYIGSLTHDEIEKKVMSCLASHKAVAEPFVAKCSCYPERDLCEKEESMPISQGRLCLGFRSDVMPHTKDYYSAVIFNELFGGSPSSKLFMNVREKMSLCYSCASYYNPLTGSIRVNAGIASENKEITERAILTELENIRLGKISERELICAKKSVENSYREIYDCPTDIMNFYANRKSFGVDCTIDECRENLCAVTMEDVIKFANRLKLDSIYFLRSDGTVGEDDEEGDDE